MSAAFVKYRSIWAFLGQLAREIDSEQYQVVDHWDADLFAIGVASLGEPGQLAYVSTYQQEADHFAVECEMPGSDTVAARGVGLTFDAAVEMIRRHLTLAKPTTARS